MKNIAAGHLEVKLAKLLFYGGAPGWFSSAIWLCYCPENRSHPPHLSEVGRMLGGVSWSPDQQNPQRTHARCIVGGFVPRIAGPLQQGDSSFPTAEDYRETLFINSSAINELVKSDIWYRGDPAAVCCWGWERGRQVNNGSRASISWSHVISNINGTDFCKQSSGGLVISEIRTKLVSNSTLKKLGLSKSYFHGLKFFADHGRQVNIFFFNSPFIFRSCDHPLGMLKLIPDLNLTWLYPQ